VDPTEGDCLRDAGQSPGWALVLATQPGATEVVGGLPLAARAVLALWRAGVAEPWVFAGSARRELEAVLAQRGVTVRWITGAADVHGSGGATGIAEPGCDRLLIVPCDHLVDGAGVGRAPACDARAVAGLPEDVAAGRPLAETLRRAGAPVEPRTGDGLFVPLDALHSRAALEAALLDDLARRTTTGDSYMAALLDRWLSRPIIRHLLPWSRLSPSAITLVSVTAGLLGAAGLATTGYLTHLTGVLGLVASIVLDCVDGEIARARFEQSATGARLDVVGDYLVNLSVFVGLGIGLWREGLGPSVAWVATRSSPASPPPCSASTCSSSGPRWRTAATSTGKGTSGASGERRWDRSSRKWPAATTPTCSSCSPWWATWSGSCTPRPQAPGSLPGDWWSTPFAGEGGPRPARRQPR